MLLLIFPPKATQTRISDSFGPMQLADQASNDDAQPQRETQPGTTGIASAPRGHIARSWATARASLGGSVAKRLEQRLVATTRTPVLSQRINPRPATSGRRIPAPNHRVHQRTRRRRPETSGHGGSTNPPATESSRAAARGRHSHISPLLQASTPQPWSVFNLVSPSY